MSVSRHAGSWCVVLCAVLYTTASLSASGNDTRIVDTRIVDAVKAGNRDAVRALLAKPADVNAPEADGTRAIHWAVRADDLEMVRLLLAAGAHASAANRYGVTPLALAATNGSAAMLEALMKAGADPKAALPEGETVLMRAARTGKADALEVLINQGVDVNAKESWLGETALMWAAAQNHAAAVQVLAAHGADLNAKSALSDFPRRQSGQTVLPRGGWTPLMYAARQGALAAVRTLADVGANLNLTDPDGANALVLAIINAHYDVAGLLLDKGANPNIADANGMAALYAAVDMHTLAWTFTRPDPKPADRMNSLDVVKALLAHGANPNAALKKTTLERQHTPGDAILAEGATPFMRAAKTGDVVVMRVLKDSGANPSLTAKNHTTPVMLAAGLGWRSGNEVARDRATEADQIAAIELCLEWGGDLDAFNSDGQTALHAAVERGADAIVKFLAERGASLDSKDKQGRTPVDLALGGSGGRRGRPAEVRESTVAVLRQFMDSRPKDASQ